MANAQNLIPNSERTPEELREQTRRAGIASGKKRRLHKTMREWAQYLAKCPVEIRTPDGQSLPGDLAGQTIIAQFHKATKGDTAAAKFLGELLNEVKEAGGVNINVSVQSKEDADAVAAILNGGRK